MAVAALVLGILSLVFMFIPIIGVIAIPMSIVAIILGVLGKKSLEAQGKTVGIATAGMVTGIIALIISIIFTLICGACAAACAAPFALL